MRFAWERRLIAALAVLALGAGADSASAATAKSATFRAELSGTQFARTDVGAVSENNCQLPSGTSTERIEFQSSTFTLLFTELPPSEVFLGRNGTVPVSVNGTVTRSNLGSAACLDDPKVPEDCGALPVGAWGVQLEWKVRGFYLISKSVKTDVFGNCASRLLFDPFPDLFGAADGEKQVVARASIRQLLDRHKRQIVAIGKGNDSAQSRDASLSVNLDYRLTLTRQKAPRRKR